MARLDLRIVEHEVGRVRIAADHEFVVLDRIGQPVFVHDKRAHIADPDDDRHVGLLTRCHRTTLGNRGANASFVASPTQGATKPALRRSVFSELASSERAAKRGATKSLRKLLSTTPWSGAVGSLNRCDDSWRI